LSNSITVDTQRQSIMRSYADTLSGTKPQGAATASSACFKFTSVMVGLLLIAGAVFVGIRFLPEDTSTGGYCALLLLSLVDCS
jgi:hypothetical protein